PGACVEQPARRRAKARAIRGAARIGPRGGSEPSAGPVGSSMTVQRQLGIGLAGLRIEAERLGVVVAPVNGLEEGVEAVADAVRPRALLVVGRVLVVEGGVVAPVAHALHGGEEALQRVVALRGAVAPVLRLGGDVGGRALLAAAGGEGDGRGEESEGEDGSDQEWSHGRKDGCRPYQGVPANLEESSGGRRRVEFSSRFSSASGFHGAGDRATPGPRAGT